GRRCRWYVLDRMIPKPRPATSSGVMVLTVACVPTGMNTGVSMSPRGVVSTPVRALVSVLLLVTRNEMAMDRSSHTSQNQHRVAEAEKAVPLLHRLAIRGQRPLPAQEGADQHEQAGAGQVEVGQQAVDDPPAVARIDEQVRPARGLPSRPKTPARGPSWCPRR